MGLLRLGLRCGKDSGPSSRDRSDTPQSPSASFSLGVGSHRLAPSSGRFLNWFRRLCRLSGLPTGTSLMPRPLLRLLLLHREQDRIDDRFRFTKFFVSFFRVARPRSGVGRKPCRGILRAVVDVLYFAVAVQDCVVSIPDEVLGRMAPVSNLPLASRSLCPPTTKPSELLRILRPAPCWSGRCLCRGLSTMTISATLYVALAFGIALGRAAAQPVDVPPDAMIRLQRTSCYGPCPIYTVTIDARDTATYDGAKHVRVVGRRTAQVDPAVTTKLLAARNAFDSSICVMPTG